MIEPLLSVCLITYNHVKYIRQAIEGVLMQQVNFTWELIIADDCSTDGTREILLEYKEKYPGFIKLILQEKNAGPAKNYIDLITLPESKYIAYFEGDDYWTDPYKLQKQVDFLEANSDFSLCFHNVIIKHEDLQGEDGLFCKPTIKDITGIDDVIEGWYIPSVSMVYRTEYVSTLPGWYNEIYNGDYALHMLLALKGKIKYFRAAMGVYRKNSGALSGGIGKNYLFVYNEIIKLLETFNIYSNFHYSKKIEKRIKQIKKEIRDLEIRKKYPVYKYLNRKIWISKMNSIIKTLGKNF